MQPFGEGIRELENNRYIFSHDTNGGALKKLPDGKKAYVDVVALSRGPRTYSPPSRPAWRVFLANGKGEGKKWYCNDYEQLRPGWHHFVLRWDRGKPLLQLLIDGAPIIEKQDYRKYWPNTYSDTAIAGTWRSYHPVHFVETWLYRTVAVNRFLSDEYIRRELSANPPDVS